MSEPRSCPKMALRFCPNRNKPKEHRFSTFGDLAVFVWSDSRGRDFEISGFLEEEKGMTNQHSVNVNGRAPLFAGRNGYRAAMRSTLTVVLLLTFQAAVLMGQTGG